MKLEQQVYTVELAKIGVKKNAAIEKFVDDAMNNRAKVLDDFCKVYIASRADWFRKNPARLSSLELCIQKTSDGLGETYSFRVKRGKRIQPK